MEEVWNLSKRFVPVVEFTYTDEVELSEFNEMGKYTV